jgi:hypothetical protein
MLTRKIKQDKYKDTNIKLTKNYKYKLDTYTAFCIISVKPDASQYQNA